MSGLARNPALMDNHAISPCNPDQGPAIKGGIVPGQWTMSGQKCGSEERQNCPILRVSNMETVCLSLISLRFALFGAAERSLKANSAPNRGAVAV
jgi:hypothetical protein